MTCSFGEGVTVKPDGAHELDPCVYEDKEAYANVTVFVRVCKHCGKVDIVWRRQENTEELSLDESPEM